MTTYDYINRNKLKSMVLVIVFLVFVSFLGWAIGEWTGYGISGLFFAVIVAVAMTIGGYFAGDRVALATAGARGPVSKRDNPYVYNLVENLCIGSGTPLPKIYVMNDSTINAFATGRDPRHASIAVTAGAVEKLENEELEGILAHELSHIRNYDVRFMMLVLMLVSLVTLMARWFFYAGRFGSNRGGNRGNGAGIFAIVGIILLVLSPLIGQLIQLAVSRRREFLADASGALLTRFPEGLAKALGKISRENTRPLLGANEATAHLFFDTPFGRSGKKLSSLFLTHPPIEERIKALQTMAG